MNMVTTIEPCNKCKKKYLSKGVLLLEAKKEPIGKTQPIPTGKLTILKDKAFSKIFNKPIPKQKICFVEVGILDKMTK